MKVLKHDLETLILKIFNKFSMSSKKVDELKECFQFVQRDFHNIFIMYIEVR